MPTVPFVRDDRPHYNLIPTLIISSNVTTLFFVVIGAVVVMLTKGFRFKEKKTRTDEYIKQRQMTFRLGRDPDSVPKPKFSDQKELEKEDKKIIYNRLRDPSQFVFEGFGFKRPLTIALYIYRVMLALWMTVQMTIDPSYFRPKTFMTYFSFLTNTSALLFAIYYICQAVFGLFYITSCYKYFNESDTSGPSKSIEELNPWLRKFFNLISTIIWLLAEWNHVAAIIIAIGYWVMVIPDLANGKPTNNDPDPMSYFTFGYHGMQAIFNIIEFFMSNLVFRIWHIFLVMLYPALYCIWIQVIMEAEAATVWPYAVIDYYRMPWYSVLFYIFGLFFVFVFMFLVFWAVTTIRLMILTKKLKSIRLFRRKSEVQKVNGILADSVNTFVNTMLELDQIVDEKHIQAPSVNYKANMSISTSMSTTPPVSPMSTFPATDEHAVSPPGLIHMMSPKSSTGTPQYAHQPLISTSGVTVAGIGYDEPLAPRGTRKTQDVVNKLIKIKNSSLNNSGVIEQSIEISPTSPSQDSAVILVIEPKE